MTWPAGGVVSPDEITEDMEIERAFGPNVGDSDAAYDEGYAQGFSDGGGGGGGVPTQGQTWPRGNP